jgi:membrane protease YdiL (CAAX protease family)
MTSILSAVAIGTLVVIVGTVPRNIAFAANFRFLSEVPWAVPLMAVYLWCFWRYLGGDGPPEVTREFRRQSLRANRVSPRVWAWSLLAGGLGLVALVLALRLANRLVELPQQQIPNLANVPAHTVWTLVLVGAPIAGLVEEAAFRGYMQGPIERRYGLIVAILTTGTMFALVHLDFTLVLWPYYVAVSAVYGTVAFLTNSVWPAVVLHTSGNVYSNIDLLLHGRADWQAPAGSATLVGTTGVDSGLVQLITGLGVIFAAMLWAYTRLAAIIRLEHDMNVGSV